MTNLKQEAKEVAAVFGWVAAGIATVFGLGVVTLYFNGYFAPKVEEVRRNTYVQSESHVRGTVMDLRKLKLEYEKEKDPAAKSTLLGIARDTASQVPIQLLPLDLQTFVRDINNGYQQ